MRPALKHTLPLTVLVGIAMLGIAPATMQEALAQKAPAQVQKDYDAFIVKFRAALKANDAAAVTELTQFPFVSGEKRNAAYFKANLYAELFKPRIRACLQRAKAVYDRAPDGSENFTAFCGEDLFLFTQTKDGFKFAEAGVND